MYLLHAEEGNSDAHRLDRMEDVNDALLIFEGDCTCCRRKHEGTNRCDKEYVRDIVLGVYAEVLYRTQHVGQHSQESGGRSDAIYAAINNQKERMFPKTFKADF